MRFNPRARAGRDAATWSAFPIRFLFQSTRPRGARPPCSCAAACRPHRFNPRARAGRDKTSLEDNCHPFPFQSTRPRGARQCRTEAVQIA